MLKWANDLLVQQMLFQGWESGAWVDQMKMDNTYDNNDFLIETVYQMWDETAWIPTTKWVFTKN